VGLKQGFGTKILWSALLSFLATGGLAGFALLNVKNLVSSQRELLNSEDAMLRISKMVTYVLDMETGERGYMLSGDSSFLDPYNAAEDTFDKFVRETQSLLSAQPEQLKRLDRILELKKSWIEGPAVEEMLARRKLDAGRIQTTEFIQIFRGTRGKELTAQ